MIPAHQPEREFALFLGFVTHYFESVTGTSPSFHPPLLETSLPAQLDYTGYLPVTGRLNGWVGLSLSSPLLCHLLRHLGEEEHDHAAQLDLVSEMAGSITSHAREHFGERLLLQPPLVSTAEEFPEELVPPPLFFRLPFAWSGEQAYLLVALHL